MPSKKPQGTHQHEHRYQKTVQQADILDQAEAKLPAVRQPRARTVAAPMQAQPTTPMDLLRIVTERGASVDELTKFMDLLERQQANEASQAYMRAITAFKRTVQTIYRDEHAAFKAKNKDTGAVSEVSYDFATLGHICEKIIVQMADHSLSHRWVIEQPENHIRVTCVLSHEKGHSETASIQYAADSSGSKNPLQAINSSVTYGERTSLLAVCGIAVKSQGDDDGRGAGEATAELRELAANMKKPGTTAPAKHVIDAPTLKRALAAIKSDNYTYADLIDYYALTPEQLAMARKELGIAGDAA
jgi:hypothetical protein